MIKKKQKILAGFTAIFIILTLATQVVFAADVTVSTIGDLKLQVISSLNQKLTSFNMTYTSGSSSNATGLKNALIKAIDEAQKNTNEDVQWSIDSLGYTVTGTIGNAQLKFTVKYLSTLAQDKQVDAKIDQILKTIITPGLSDTQKERIIHDYILTNVDYVDTGNISHTAYSALFNGKAVCQGYAILFYKMLKNEGIENKIVTGTGDGVAHMWNVVKLGGVWYMVDVTWDDPLPNAPGARSHQFFNVTSAFMKANGHVWVEADFPVANTVFDTQTDTQGTGVNNTAQKVDQVPQTIKTVIPSKTTSKTQKNIPYPTIVKNTVNAVAKAERSKTRSTIDLAKALLLSLKDGTEKTNLAKRLDAVQLTMTTSLVEKAELSQTVTDYNTAKVSVAAIQEGVQKNNLLLRLDSIHTQVIESAVSKAEETCAQRDFEMAEAIVNAMPPGTDKANFNVRLNDLLDTIALLTVEKAESTLSNSDIAAAGKAVALLADGSNKAGLLNRISAIPVTKAQNALAKAESSKTQEDMDNARAVINALGEGEDKTNLTERLAALELNISLNYIAVAESTLQITDIDKARKSILSLANSPFKNNLEERISKIAAASQIQ